MKNLKLAIAIVALALTTGITYASKATAPNDCSVNPGGPGTLNSSDCSGSGNICCYLVSNGMEIDKN